MEAYDSFDISLKNSKENSMNELGYFEMTVKRSNGEEINLKMWEEATISDWIPVFKSILNWATYHPDNIDELFSKDGEN